MLIEMLSKYQIQILMQNHQLHGLNCIPGLQPYQWIAKGFSITKTSIMKTLFLLASFAYRLWQSVSMTFNN